MIHENNLLLWHVHILWSCAIITRSAQPVSLVCYYVMEHKYLISVVHSEEHQIEDGGNMVQQSLVAKEEFASNDVQSPPEGDKTKLSLNKELGQLRVFNSPMPLSPDNTDTNTSQKGILYAKQKHLGCKKTARSIRSSSK